MNRWMTECIYVSHPPPLNKLPGYQMRLNLVRYFWLLAKLYSDRKLTCISDKLMAIQGIINRIALKTGWNSIAGLWKEGMPFELFWQCLVPQPQPSVGPYRAPSWSWVSVDITMVFNPLIPNRYQPLEISLGSAEAVDIHVATEHLGHRIQGGWIILEGMMRRMGSGTYYGSSQGMATHGSWIACITLFLVGGTLSLAVATYFRFFRMHIPVPLPGEKESYELLLSPMLRVHPAAV